MDLHKDLQSFRLAQSVLRKDEVTDRVLDVVNRDARRVDDYLSVLNETQVGMQTPTQLRHQFYLGDERVMSKLIPMQFDNRDEMLMQSSSGDILDMYEWHRGAGNTDLHSFLVAHNDFSKQYAQQFAQAPVIPPYAAELDIDKSGNPVIGAPGGDLPGGPLPPADGGKGDTGGEGDVDGEGGDAGADNGGIDLGARDPFTGIPPGALLTKEEATRIAVEAQRAWRRRNIPLLNKAKREITAEANRQIRALESGNIDYDDEKQRITDLLHDDIEKQTQAFDEQARAVGMDAYRRARGRAQ